MNEKAIHKGLLIAGGLLGLGLLGYLFFREKEETTEDAEFTIVDTPKKTEKPKPVVVKKPNREMKVVTTEKVEKSTLKKEKIIADEVKVPSEPNDDFPLKLGSEGERVTQLQVYLLKNHGTASF